MIYRPQPPTLERPPSVRHLGRTPVPCRAAPTRPIVAISVYRPPVSARSSRGRPLPSGFMDLSVDGRLPVVFGLINGAAGRLVKPVLTLSLRVGNDTSSKRFESVLGRISNYCDLFISRYASESRRYVTTRKKISFKQYRCGDTHPRIINKHALGREALLILS